MPKPDLASPAAGLGPIPEANLPGHHPEVEQDKPTGPPPRPRRTGRTLGAPSLAAVPEHYAFRFEPTMLALSAPFGVLPPTTDVEVGDHVLIRFGPWRMRFPRSDVSGVEETTDYDLLRVAGPPHLSLKDRGITFATNRERGLCIQLERPHRGIEPFGLLRHPAVTVTVEAIDALAEHLLRD